MQTYSPNVDTSFFFGLLLSVPLSILGNILTPKFQTWNARRSQGAAKKLAAEDQKFAARIERFRRNPEDYQAFFQLNLLYIVGGIARMVMIAGIGILASTLLPGTVDGEMVALLALGLLAVDGLFLSRRGSGAYRVAAALRVTTSKEDPDAAPQAESSA